MHAIYWIAAEKIAEPSKIHDSLCFDLNRF